MAGRFQLGARYCDCVNGFDDLSVIPQNEKELILCRSYVENLAENLKSGRSLRFFGDIGTGKSTLAWALTYEVRARGYKALWTNWDELQDQAMSHQEYRRWVEYMTEQRSVDWTVGENVPSLVRELWDADFLAIDDTIVPFRSHAQMNALVAIIKARHKAKKPTVVVDCIQASNAGANPHIATWLEAIAAAEFEEIRFHGADYRTERAASAHEWAADLEEPPK